MTEQIPQWAIDQAQETIVCLNHSRNDICYPNGVAGKGSPEYCGPHTKVALALVAARSNGITDGIRKTQENIESFVKDRLKLLEMSPAAKKGNESALFVAINLQKVLFYIDDMNVEEIVRS